MVSFDEFANGNKVFVKPHPNRKYNDYESLVRATQRLGEDWYNVLANNCEHFVTWCIEGFHSSSQVNTLIAGVAGAVGARTLLTAAVTTTTQAAATQILVTQTTNSAVTTIVPSIAKSVLSNYVGAAAGIATGAGIASGAGVGATTTGVVVLGLTTVVGTPLLIGAGIGVGIVGVGVGVGLTAKNLFGRWFV